MQNRLKEMMKKKDIRVTDLVRLTKIHYSKISRMRSNIEGPTDSQKQLIAKALKCRVEEIFPVDESHSEG